MSGELTARYKDSGSLNSAFFWMQCRISWPFVALLCLEWGAQDLVQLPIFWLLFFLRILNYPLTQEFHVSCQYSKYDRLICYLGSCINFISITVLDREGVEFKARVFWGNQTILGVFVPISISLLPSVRDYVSFYMTYIIPLEFSLYSWAMWKQFEQGLSLTSA